MSRREWVRWLFVVSGLLVAVPSPTFAERETHDLTLAASGTVTIDGRTTVNVEPGIDLDRFTWVALDRPATPVDEFTATLHLPKPVDSSRPPAFKLLGIKGVGSVTSRLVDPTTVVYRATAIQPTAELSVLADFPKGYLTLPAVAQASVTIQRLSGVWVAFSLIVPGLGFLLLLSMAFARWRDHQRPPSSQIMTSSPSQVAPALVSVLYDDKIEPEAIAATLVDLANRGYLSIYAKGANFVIAKERAVDLATPSFRLGEHDVVLSKAERATATREGLKPFEKILLSKLFVAARPISSKEDVQVRIGHGLFSKKVVAIYQYLFAEASSTGIFVPHAAQIHQRYLLAGWLLFFAGALGFGIGAVTLPDPKVFLLFWAGLIGVAYVIVRLAPYVPLRTARGRRELAEFLAYRAYLSNRAPIPVGTSIDAFTAHLPTAWALRVHHQWAKRFRPVIFQRPAWYFTNKKLTSSVDFIEDIDHLVSFVAESFSSVREKSLA